METRPQAGNQIAARRKVKSKIYHNLVIGPVYDVTDNAVYVHTNKGTDIETIWTLYDREWDYLILDI
jgi:hypothetical protein